MTSACDPLGSFARGLADSGAASLMSVSRGTEEIASAMADYMRSSFRAGGEFARAFLAAASVRMPSQFKRVTPGKAMKRGWRGPQR